MSEPLVFGLPVSRYIATNQKILDIVLSGISYQLQSHTMDPLSAKTTSQILKEAFPVMTREKFTHIDFMIGSDYEIDDISELDELNRYLHSLEDGVQSTGENFSVQLIEENKTQGLVYNMLTSTVYFASCSTATKTREPFSITKSAAKKLLTAQLLLMRLFPDRTFLFVLKDSGTSTFLRIHKSLEITPEDIVTKVEEVINELKKEVLEREEFERVASHIYDTI